MDLVTVDFERTLRASSAHTRQALLETLRQLGFQLDRTQGAVVEAHRGSGLRAGIGGPRPLRLSATVTGHGDTTSLRVHLGDGETFATGTDALKGMYTPHFAEVQERLDQELRELDRSLPPTTPAPITVNTAAKPAVERGISGLMRRLPGAVRKPAAKAMKQEISLLVVAPDVAVTLTPEEADTCLAIAAMVSADPTALPSAMSRRVENVLVAMSNALAAGKPPAARLEITDADKPAVEFLWQQARLRERLPAREIHRCRDCTLERVVNPDYQKQAAKGRKRRGALGIAGAAAETAANPLMVVTMMNVGDFKGEIDACTRCQGIDMDVSLATICRRCHEIRGETVLTGCPACGYLFLNRIAGESLWARAVPTPPAPALAPAAPAPATATETWAPPTGPGKATPWDPPTGPGKATPWE